ncbi:hypothetical protein HDU76_011219 [Blyttiomyces sp. JEL0837]|nr:hypothetical protein HDU76_011219 [Blyttiomyces sp. JEL0837]
MRGISIAGGLVGSVVAACSLGTDGICARSIRGDPLFTIGDRAHMDMILGNTTDFSLERVHFDEMEGYERYHMTFTEAASTGYEFAYATRPISGSSCGGITSAILNDAAPSLGNKLSQARTSSICHLLSNGGCNYAVVKVVTGYQGQANPWAIGNDCSDDGTQYETVFSKEYDPPQKCIINHQNVCEGQQSRK